LDNFVLDILSFVACDLGWPLFQAVWPFLDSDIFFNASSEKIFVLQEILFKDGKKELRLGYYIIGKKPRAKGKWVWGQFCPFFPKKDLIKLIEKAKKEGIL